MLLWSEGPLSGFNPSTLPSNPNDLSLSQTAMKALPPPPACVHWAFWGRVRRRTRVLGRGEGGSVYLSHVPCLLVHHRQQQALWALPDKPGPYISIGVTTRRGTCASSRGVFRAFRNSPDQTSCYSHHHHHCSHYQFTMSHTHILRRTRQRTQAHTPWPPSP